MIWKTKYWKSSNQNTKKEKRILKNSDSLRDLQENIKRTNIHIVGIPEGEGSEKGAKSLFKELIAGNSPNLKKKLDMQLYELIELLNTSMQKEVYAMT